MKLDSIRTKLEQSVNNGTPIPLVDVFLEIEQLHQETMHMIKNMGVSTTFLIRNSHPSQKGK